MSDSQPDPRSRPEDEPGLDAVEESDAIVPLPVHDDVTIELVRDAIGVARGELSDERFSEKYGTPEASSDGRDQASDDPDGDRPDR